MNSVKGEERKVSTNKTNVSGIWLASSTNGVLYALEKDLEASVSSKYGSPPSFMQVQICTCDISLAGIAWVVDLLLDPIQGAGYYL